MRGIIPQGSLFVVHCRSGGYAPAMSGTSAGATRDPIRTLLGLGALRVGSVIVTIFGDAALPRGGAISAGALSEIAARLRISPVAVRVAVLRLARQGWLERRREGRGSIYALTESGMAEFLPASERIYAPAPGRSGPWSLAILPPNSPAPKGRPSVAGFARLAPGIYLGSASAPPPPEAGLMIGRFETIPVWIRSALGDPDLSAEYVRLTCAIGESEALLRSSPPVEPIAAVALRILTIHHWRRLLLRRPDLPQEFYPPDWPGERCREAALRLHARLAPLAEPWLANRIGPPVERRPIPRVPDGG